MNVWFCSDLHIGHTNITRFRKEVTSEQHNRDIIKHFWDKLVSKRDPDVEERLERGY